MTDAEKAARRAELEAQGVTSRDNDGWCGVPCPAVDCHGGEVEDDHGRRSCGRCGGTGERYETALDDRKYD